MLLILFNKLYVKKMLTKGWNFKKRNTVNNVNYLKT